MTDRDHAGSGSPFEPLIGFSRAIRVGDHVHVSGTGPVFADGSCDPDPAVQAKRCLDIIVVALADLGATADDVAALLDPRWKVEIEADAIVGP